MADEWRLYYDADCGFCQAAVRRAVRWAKRYGQPLVVLPLDGPEAGAKGYGNTLTLEADRVYYGGDAWLQVFSFGPPLLRLLTLLRLTAPTRRLVARLYDYAALHRHCIPTGGRIARGLTDEQSHDVQRAGIDDLRVPDSGSSSDKLLGERGDRREAENPLRP